MYPLPSTMNDSQLLNFWRLCVGFWMLPASAPLGFLIWIIFQKPSDTEEGGEWGSVLFMGLFVLVFTGLCILAVVFALLSTGDLSENAGRIPGVLMACFSLLLLGFNLELELLTPSSLVNMFLVCLVADSVAVANISKKLSSS